MRSVALAGLAFISLAPFLHAEMGAYSYSHPSICRADNAPFKVCLTAGDVIEFFQTEEECKEAAEALNVVNHCRRVWIES